MGTELIVTVLETVAAWGLGVVGLAMLALMAALPLLENLAQRPERPGIAR